MRDRVVIELERREVITIESTVPDGVTLRDWRRRRAAARSRRRRLLSGLPLRRAA
jgi:hypothetical protein